ncbi:hypothetical protein LP419_04000 [Massilia sp. H-1]|nr:hypothetical protein LP419_04000 [Massilia sp. H-1]
MEMAPDDLVFAYENEVGFVAVGCIRNPKDLQTGHGGGALYPKQTETVRSMAVDWDTSITRTTQEVSAHTPVGKNGLQRVNPNTSLHDYMLGMLEEAHTRYQQDPDGSELAAADRILNSASIDKHTKAQLRDARIGQGRFREAVLKREASCLS